MIQSIYQIRKERTVEYARLAQNKYGSAVRAIYGRRKRGVAPTYIGSCVLLSVNGTRFLVTAGHVTDHAKETTLHVAGDKELVPLSFDAGLTTIPEMRRDKDVHDFSVCALSDVMQKELGDVRYITEKEMYKTAPAGPNRLRMVMGYPTSKNKRGIDNPRMRIGGSLWHYVSLAPVKDPDSDHLSIEFDHKESMNPDGIGTHSLSPNGASGGAMFDLGKFDDPERLGKPAHCEAKLIGILTDYWSKHKLIVAISVKPVLDVCRGLLSMGES
jgi:hypothetical protein